MIRGKLTACAIIVLLKASIRAQCKAQVYRIPHNVYQGFRTRVEAERAYVLAFAMDSLRILPRREASADTGPAPGGPTPEALMQAFAMASDDFLGAKWHVVFKGKRPGVYPAWLVTFISSLFITCV
jgi:hypothetical protein